MDINHDKIDDCTLALLYLVTSEGPYGARAWKSFDWDTMDRLHKKGYISDPKSKAKSVAVSEEGLSRGEDFSLFAAIRDAGPMGAHIEPITREARGLVRHGLRHSLTARVQLPFLTSLFQMNKRALES